MRRGPWSTRALATRRIGGSASWLLTLLLAGCAAPSATLDDDDLLGDDDDLFGDDDDVGDDDDAGDDDDDDTPDNATLTEEPLPACAAPVPSPGSYEDALAGSGIDFVHATDPALTEDADDLVMAFADVMTTGVVAADLDGDGAIDLFLTSTIGPSRFYWGQGDATFAPGEGILPDALTGLANAADHDGDGDLDLLVGGWQHLRLLRNDGARQFTDVTEAIGIIQPDGWAGGAAWADWDGDGDLDLYAGGYVSSSETDHETFWNGVSSDNVLYRNEPGGFVDERALLGPLPEEDGTVIHALWRDLDHDGDPDLVQVNDFGDILINTFVWENALSEGGGFVERAVSGGVPYMAAPMGCLAEDIDGDGWEDLWFSDFGEHIVLRSAAGGFSWLDVTLAWMGLVPLANVEASWSMMGTDLDGDGELEVFVPYGPIPGVFSGNEPLIPDQPDRFFVNTGTRAEPVFRDLRDDVLPLPMDGLSRGAAEADFNGDGVPDLIVSHVGLPPSLLLGRCTTSSRLTVDLRDPGSANRFGIGARVTVSKGPLVQTRTVDAGGRGTYSGQAPSLLLGLGTGAERVRLDVQWPDGEHSVFEDVCGHCRVLVTREPAPR